MGLGLGRGISSLLERESDCLEKVSVLPIDSLQPGRFQPRRSFEPEALQELADSIKEHGILQPIVVRKLDTNKFEIIAGERRFRASILIGLSEVPIIVRELNDAEALQLAIIENIQRKDLNIVEEAESYQRLIKEFKFKQEELAKILSKKRSHIANILRINKLDIDVKDMLANQEISFGHAKLLVGMDNAANLAEQISKEKLTVRAAEQLIKKQKKSKNSKSKSTKESNIEEFDMHELEKILQSSLNTKVKIEKNKIILEFDDMAKLDFIINKVSS